MAANDRHENRHSGDFIVWAEAVRRPQAEAIPEGLSGAWWVAHTRPRQEKALARDLHRSEVFVYLPLAFHATSSRNTGRVTTSVVPVFPGYLFFSGSDAERHGALRTNRIVSILPVPDQAVLVRQLRQIQRVLASEQDFHRHRTIQVGQFARVILGPLAGLEGRVSQRRSRLRLVLNLRMLGQAVSVEVSEDMVVRIDGPEGNAIIPPIERASSGPH